MWCCHHFLTHPKTRICVSGVAQGRDYHTLTFYWSKSKLQKEWGSDLVTAVTRQFRQTPSPEHGNDCLTLISGSCFQKTYPLPTFNLCIQKNGQSPTKLRNTGYKNNPDKKFWEWLADGKRPKGCLRQFYSRDVTFTATGKHISKLFKVTSRGKRWRNRPF